MDFIEVNITCDQEALKDILTAELGDIGFDTFQETDSGLLAYIDSVKFEENLLLEVIDQYSPSFEFSYATRHVAKENWNKKWEENYDPIEVDDRCIVRATFHKVRKDYPIEILINPKMSFGTGHHATTLQMLRLQMGLDFKEKAVLDVGSGTGVLAIMAFKLGASHIEATDIDDWCIENGRENFQLNGLAAVEMKKGPIDEVEFGRKFDIVLANINKNVLLGEIGKYASLLKPNGRLLLSGFYKEDQIDIEFETNKHQLRLEKATDLDEWVAAQFVYE